MDGKLTLGNGAVVDSVRAIATTISLANLLKEGSAAILLSFGQFCRENISALDPNLIDVELLCRLKLCDEHGEIDEDVRNVTICTVRGYTVANLKLVSPTEKIT
ncbi:MAG: hypothetical protein HUU49_04125 [Candidatus Buchananbacteria bacterium]|nr:hypothetical protein [Candidatus Buchananbacteria bacterium]